MPPGPYAGIYEQLEVKHTMMIYPPINELMDMVDYRYTLVMETAKRARQLVAGDARLIDTTDDMKPVSIAVQEIYEGKVEYERPESIK